MAWFGLAKIALQAGGKIYAKKHMSQMKKDMKKGTNFKKAHNKAMKKVGV